MRAQNGRLEVYLTSVTRLGGVVFIVLMMLLPGLAAKRGAGARTVSQGGQGESGGQRPVGAAAGLGSRVACDRTGESELTIACGYGGAEGDGEQNGEPLIAIERFVISFHPKSEGPMRVELAFSNRGKSAMKQARAVYMAIDDDEGNNYLRRELKLVDLDEVDPGESVTFSEQLLSAAYMPGHYVVHLWIPNPDPALKFNPRYNTLLANAGISDAASGLNTIAGFTVGK
jgi:hypothetical protein